MTAKPTAAIDKSLFHEICKLPTKETRDKIWNSLTGKYQIVVPWMLVEEVLVNRIKPGTIPESEVQMMVSDILQLQTCWIDDVSEYAFRELVQNQPLKKFVAPPNELQQELLALKIDDPEVIKWVEQRKVSRKATAAQWKVEQMKVAPPGGFHILGSEQEFFERVLKPEILDALDNPVKKLDTLEVILGETFRFRHPAATGDIDRAFAQYGKNNFASFWFTFACLTVRLAYVLAPVFRIQAAKDSEPRIILNPKRCHQDNNWADEQYVISAQLCDRLLTMDKGMRNVANIFQASQLWKGQTIFSIPKNHLPIKYRIFYSEFSESRRDSIFQPSVGESASLPWVNQPK